MKKALSLHSTLSLSAFLMLVMLPGFLAGQEWELQKNKEGISLFTRKLPDSSLKSYKGVMEIDADAIEVYRLVTNYDNYPGWDADIREMRVVSSVPDSQYIYYMSYDAPWPFQDRDRVAVATVSLDRKKGVISIINLPAVGVLPENDQFVRIRDFHETWTIAELENGKTRVTIEGYNDPGGNLPAWVVNIGIVDAPFKMMKGIKEEAEE